MDKLLEITKNFSLALTGLLDTCQITIGHICQYILKNTLHFKWNILIMEYIIHKIVLNSEITTFWLHKKKRHMSFVGQISS